MVGCVALAGFRAIEPDLAGVRRGGDTAEAVPGVIVVIGAGVCGLAAAYELSRRGERAIVLERGEPFAEQSAGLGRIFRIAHRRPELCALALEARAGWQRSEAELGAGRRRRR